MEESGVRITRLRAKALGTSKDNMQKPPRPELKKTLRAGSKRKSSDENNPMCLETDHYSQNKRRAVLSDVSNIFFDRSLDTSGAVKIQTKKQLKGYPTRKNLKEAQSVSTRLNQGVNVKGKSTERVTKITGESVHIILPRKAREASDASIQCELASHVKTEKNVGIDFGESCDGDQCYEADTKPIKQCSRMPSGVAGIFKKVPVGKPHKHSETFIDPEIVDIDLNQKDPQMCSIYVAEIYNNIRVNELNCRPSIDYMDKVQRDITQSMRRILIDWIVEVSEEYKLVPDTLYLTVSLIDRFLSCNYMEKQRLQLLGVTCMLIASKYEEISAPRVEDFCLITDNTYSKEEVVKMESAVLNFLRFQLSVPTIKTFLRRFIQAAKATSENPSVDVEYLANYFAELTLIEYSFLQHLPSLIAASAILLARWTLDQSIEPWNPTLEHYTTYKIMDLKATVVAIEKLQSNAKNSASDAIREKYRQQKYNCVANLSSSKAVETLFSI